MSDQPNIQHIEVDLRGTTAQKRREERNRAIASLFLLFIGTVFLTFGIVLIWGPAWAFVIIGVEIIAIAVLTALGG